jgi:4-phytase/acid phosphatase
MDRLALKAIFGRRIRVAAAVIAAVLVAGTGGWAGPQSTSDELRLVIILTRHGVRAPLQGGDKLAAYAAQPWPKWEVGPGMQTPRGNQLVAMMGDYYRARFIREGALTGDPAQDGPRVFVRADNDQRTIETARILGKALVPVGEPEVNALESGTPDPLFRSYEAHIGNGDPALAAAAVLGRVGGDPRSLDRAYARQLELLRGVLYGPGSAPGPDSPLNAPTRIAPGRGRYLVDISGPLLCAEQATDALLLEYADGKPLAEVGWGRVDGKVMTELLVLHELFFDLSTRTFYTAQACASNLASHIVDTLEQGATGDPVPGALGPAGERVVVLAGHDSNIANIGGLFGLNWCVGGSQLNPTFPGGALVMELWKRGGQPDSFYLQTSYVTQTLDQMREAAPLSAENPPSTAPIFVPGASGSDHDFSAPLPAFVRQARKVIDPSFIAPEP